VSDTVFLDLLLDKMSQGGLPQPMVDLMAGNAQRIYQGYALHDPHDVVILNNKLISLRALADETGITDQSGPIGAPVSDMILRVLRSKD